MTLHHASKTAQTMQHRRALLRERLNFERTSQLAPRATTQQCCRCLSKHWSHDLAKVPLKPMVHASVTSQTRTQTTLLQKPSDTGGGVTLARHSANPAKLNFNHKLTASTSNWKGSTDKSCAGQTNDNNFNPTHHAGPVPRVQ